MPNWTGDDGVSDFKSGEPEALKTVIHRAAPMLKLEHSGLIIYVEQHPAGYVITHEDFSKLLTLAGERLLQMNKPKTKAVPKRKRPAPQPRGPARRMRPDTRRRHGR